MESKKIETERVMEAGSKKLMPRDEKEGKLDARDRKMVNGFANGENYTKLKVK